MKTRSIVLICLLLAASTSAIAQKVHVDYDPDHVRGSMKTFAWAETPGTSLGGGRGPMHSRIVNSISHLLGQLGLQQVDDAPDLYVTYHTSGEDEVRVDVSGWGVSYPGVWVADSGSGYAQAAGGGKMKATVTHYKRGTLVIDIWNAATKTMVWRGMANGVVSADPATAAPKIERAIDKMILAYGKQKKRDKRKKR